MIGMLGKNITKYGHSNLRLPITSTLLHSVSAKTLAPTWGDEQHPRIGTKATRPAVPAAPLILSSSRIWFTHTLPALFCLHNAQFRIHFLYRALLCLLVRAGSCASSCTSSWYAPASMICHCKAPYVTSAKASTGAASVHTAQDCFILP